MTEIAAIVGALVVLLGAIIRLWQSRQSHDARIEASLVDRTLAREDTSAQQLDTRTDEVIRLTETVARLSAHVEAVTARVEALEGQNKRQKSLIKSLELERAALRGEIRNLEQTRGLLEEQNQHLRTGLDGVRSREKALRAEVRELRSLMLNQRPSTMPPPLAKAKAKP